DSCTTPVFQNGIDLVFGRATTQAGADAITARGEADGFKSIKTRRDTCTKWESALPGLDSVRTSREGPTDTPAGTPLPTSECVLAQEIGQFQAIFGTRPTLEDLQSVITTANSNGYKFLKTKTAPCGGYQAYVAGFKTQAEAQDFAQTATQVTGLQVVVVKA